jgi:hypothetical protein
VLNNDLKPRRDRGCAAASPQGANSVAVKVAEFERQFAGVACSPATARFLEVFDREDTCTMTDARLREIAVDYRIFRGSSVCRSGTGSIDEVLAERLAPLRAQKCAIRTAGAISTNEAFMYFIIPNWHNYSPAQGCPSAADPRLAYNIALNKSELSKTSYDELMESRIRRMMLNQRGVITRNGDDPTPLNETLACLARVVIDGLGK